MSLRRIALLSTGGTIEKTYDELSGVLKNEVSVLDVMLASLELRGVAIDRVRLMNKDSLDMSADDHTLIAHSVRDRTRTHGGPHRRRNCSPPGHRVHPSASTAFAPAKRRTGVRTPRRTECTHMVTGSGQVRLYRISRSFAALGGRPRTRADSGRPRTYPPP